MSCYQLIKTMTKFEKRTNHWLIVERLWNVVMNAEKPSSLLNKVHHSSARKMTRTVQLQAWRVHCPINAQIGLLIANHVREFCYSFDWGSNRACIFKWASRFALVLSWNYSCDYSLNCTPLGPITITYYYYHYYYYHYCYFYYYYYYYYYYHHHHLVLQCYTNRFCFEITCSTLSD